MTMSKASVSNTLQCWVTVLSPRHIVTSIPPKEWMVRPSPSLMATVLVFLKVFSRRRATMERMAKSLMAAMWMSSSLMRSRGAAPKRRTWFSGSS